MQTECKFAADFQTFRVINFRNNKYAQKQENINNSYFLL